MGEYKYSINSDFNSQKADLDRLIDEINGSSISSSLAHINVDGDDCSITFSGTLSQEELTTLSGLLNGHSGDPFEYEDVFYAESEGESTTTSYTYQQKLRLSIPDLAPGTYQVRWYFEYSE